MGNTGSKLNIYKQHILLLANADIVIPLYQSHRDNKKGFKKSEEHSLQDQEFVQGYDNNNVDDDDDDDDDDVPSIQSDLLADQSNDIIDGEDEVIDDDESTDPYSDFFNCIVENNEYLSFGDIDKSINNNDLKYIYYSNPTNFINLIKFLCFKTVRVINSISKNATSTNNDQRMDTYTTINNIDFDSNIKILLNCIRILTKIVPIFFELCYNDPVNEANKFLNEASIFWKNNTAEFYHKDNIGNVDETTGYNSIKNDHPTSPSSADNKNQHEMLQDFSSLKVDLNYKKTNSSPDASNDTNFSENQDTSTPSNDSDTPLGTNLLSSLLKCLFMEGFTLPLVNETRKGYTSFELWENGIVSSNNEFLPPNPTLDANRFEILKLVQTLCGNCLYSKTKIDNKFLASWCCCMPEYLSIYLLTSMTNVLLKSCHFSKNDYPQDYTISNKSPYQEDIVNRDDRSLQILKTNTITSNINSNAHPLHNFSNIEATQLRELFITVTTQMLTLYFQFDPSSLSTAGRAQLLGDKNAKTQSLENVAHRFFLTVQKESDFKTILISFNKVIKYAMNETLEAENNLFTLNPKKFNIFDYFGSNSTDSTSNTATPNGKAKQTSKTNDSGNQNKNNEDEPNSSLPQIPHSFNSILVLLWEFMKSNKNFEKYIMDKYSNKLFITLTYYLKYYSSNLNTKNITIPLVSQFLVYFSSSQYFLFKSLQYLQPSYYTEKLPNSFKIISNINIANTTYRDFAIMHFSRIALQDIQKNYAPKTHVYEILYNLLMAIPSALKSCVYAFSEGNILIGDLIAFELTHNGGKRGNYTSGVGYPASAQLVQLIYKTSNKEYLSSEATLNITKDSSSNATKTSELASVSSSRSASLNGSSQDDLLAKFSSETSQHCGHTINFLADDQIVNINRVSNKPYINTPAAKLDALSLILRGITNCCVHYFMDCRNLIFALTRYDKVFVNLKQQLQEINLDIEKQVEPLLLRDANTTEKNKKLPYDLCVNVKPILLDDVLFTDDEFCNFFEPGHEELLKKLTFKEFHKDDVFYFESNRNLIFPKSHEDKSTQQNRIQQRKIQQQNMNQKTTGQRQPLSVNTDLSNTTNKSSNTSGTKYVFEYADHEYLPSMNNNVVFHSTRAKRPVGLTNKKKKKIITHNSDRLRQYITPNQAHHAWFLGESDFELLFKLLLIVSSKFPQLPTLQSSQYYSVILEIGAYEKEVLEEMRAFVPWELKVEPFNKTLSVDLGGHKVAYHWLHTLVWMDVFNTCSIEYRPNLEELVEHSDLLELSRSNTFHNSIPNSESTPGILSAKHKCVTNGAVQEEEQRPPSSPMLDRWISHNSLSRTNSNTSFLNNNDSSEELHTLSLDYAKHSIPRSAPIKSRLSTSSVTSPSVASSTLKKELPSANTPEDPKMRANADAPNSQNSSNFGWKQPKEDNISENSPASRKGSLEYARRVHNYVVDHEILKRLVWNNTSVAMFSVSHNVREEFSIMDMTSSLLNKFKFKNNSSTSLNSLTTANSMNEEISKPANFKNGWKPSLPSAYS